MYDYSMTITGEPKTTVKHTCGDAAETLDDVTGFDRQYDETRNSIVMKRNVVGVLITVEDNYIRFAWGTNPVQAGVGHELGPGQSLKLTNHKQIIDFRFINRDNGSNAVLMITPEVSNL